MTNRTLDYDEYDALLQAGYEHTMGPLTESAVGQWATGWYRMPDGSNLRVNGDGTATVTPTAEEHAQERERMRAEDLAVLAGREVTFTTQEFVTWTVRDGVVVRVDADLSAPDMDFVGAITVEGCSHLWDEGLEEYRHAESGDAEDPPEDERELLDTATHLLGHVGCPIRIERADR